MYSHRTLSLGERGPLTRGVSAAALFLGVLVSANACGQTGDTVIEANKPATLLDKSDDSRWVSGTGYDHWEYTYQFLLKQCNRDKDSATDEDGCITLLVDVHSDTYSDFDEGDVIVFGHDMPGDDVFE